MQLKVAENYGTYLGIPSFWGKSKTATIRYINEQIIKKLSDWRRNVLSQEGREVLIKVVASAIPIYTMQCFKVPKKVYDEVNRAMAEFWWGQKQDKRKIHCESWSSLIKRKEKEGTGFKDLNLLNLALLGKQCWRIINNPEAMWVRILKGTYFLRCSILEASKWARASQAWTSILEGKVFFKKNMM